MKNTVYFLFLFLLINSCAVQKKPVFIKVANVKLVSANLDTIRLKAEALFKNPNDVGGKISTDEIKVFINDVALAQVSSEEFKVPARKEFVVPLYVVIPAKRVFENNKNGIIGGLINSVISRSIKVQFKGDIRYKILGFSSIYPIDNTEEIKIKI